VDEFLKLISPHDFFRILYENVKLSPKKMETVVFTDALHRIVARDIISPIDLPSFSRSTVDGFVVRADDTAGASEALPGYLTVVGEILIGEKAEIKLKTGQAIKIPTGGMLPSGANAVIMIEYTEYLDENTIEFTRPVAEGENVVQKGEDIKKGELLLKKGHLIRPQDIGALAGLGITEIVVFARPVVALISTGDEIVSPYVEPKPGEIRDINTYSIGALIEDMGVKIRRIGIVEDSFTELEKAIHKNLDCDLILISGGSSVGVKDMTIDVLNSLGEPGVIVHGISIKPGKPTILAVVDNLPIIGLPGHPASAWTSFNILVKPIIQILKGERRLEELNRIGTNVRINRGDLQIEAILSRNLVSDKGREEYIPVRIKPISDTRLDSVIDRGKVKYIAEPISGKSSLITTLVQGDGVIKIDTYQEGLNQGDIVKVQLF